MKNSKFKLIFSVFAICGVISLLITIGSAYYYQSKRTKILGLSDFSSPIQVITNISGGLPEPDFPFERPSGVAVDTQGNIYVTDIDNDQIQKYDVGTSIWTTIGSEGTEVGQFDYPKGISVDINNNIYVADSGNHRIQKYDVGTTNWIVFGSEGEEVGQFNYPDGVAIDSSGNIYVSDNDNSRIQKYNIGTTTWTAMGSAGSEVGYFSSPNGISVDSEDNIYVTDGDSNLVQKYDIGTTTWTALGTPGTGTGQFDTPNGIAIDTDNNIYVTDRCNGRVQKYTHSIQSWSTIGGSDDFCSYASFGKITKKIVVNFKKILKKFFNQVLAVEQIPQGDFDNLSGLAVDLQSNVYVVDSGNNRIQKYDPETTIWTAMGSRGTSAGQFVEPNGIDLDSYNNIYVADSGNHRIQKYDIGTTTWTIMGSEGEEAGQFFGPNSIKLDNFGNIYVADTSNHRIQKYDIGTTIWTIMGSEGAESGQFNFPGGITVDANNNIYVADSSNHRIQKYNIGTTTWTIMGSSGVEAGQFNYPTSLSIDTAGNIYVSDTDNHRIQKYNIGTTTWTIIGSEGVEAGQFNSPSGISVDTNNNIYVTDVLNHRIQKYDNETATWSAIGQYNGPIDNNMMMYSPPDGFLNRLAYLFENIIRKVMAMVSVYYNYPLDLAVDNLGNVYVSDSGNNRIQKLIYYSAPTFTISYLALDNGSITGTTTQSLSAGQSSTPVVAVGNEGYAFLEWSDGSIANPRFDIMEEIDLNVSAEFTDTRIISDVDATNINTEISREFINIATTNPTEVSNFTFNINYTFLTGSASIVFPAQTLVTPVGTSTVDLTQFSTTDNTIETKTKLDKTISSLQFGIPNFNLTFSKPVTVTIPVGSNYNNQTLQVKYHRDGEADNIWHNETNCLIISGSCTFQTTHATTFAVLENVAQTSSNNSSSANYTPDHNCHSAKPLLISDLFQIDASSNKAKIYFSPQTDTSDYFVSFSSIHNNAQEHGERVTLLREGVQSHTIYSLKPNTTYYVKVRGQNGCMPGDWSNIMTFKTNSRIYYRYSAATRANNFIQKTTSSLKKTTNTVKKVVSNTWNSIILPKTFGE